MAAGDESDFTEYFAARGPALRRLAYALSGDWHTAEDLTQATFVILYRRWSKVRAETVDAYARRILVNRFLSARHRLRRERSVADVPDRATPAEDPSGDIDLGRVLARLAPRQRATLVLRHLEDLSVAEVADLLGVTESTVKTQTHRALQALREHLAAPSVAKPCGTNPSSPEEYR